MVGMRPEPISYCLCVCLSKLSQYLYIFIYTLQYNLTQVICHTIFEYTVIINYLVLLRYTYISTFKPCLKNVCENYHYINFL